MQIHEVSLAKKTVITEDRTYLLWESVGHKLVEAQLTAQQIQQVFQQAEQGSTAAGGNRTGLGQVKDAGTEVAKAWNDLKSKVQNSGPVRNVDALYDQAAEKLKQATGGDQGVMRYVEKYRKFAKEHPIAQSFIYAALIAAAGISGAGAGGAAALGLLKMTDKLLQGEKFSSAAYAGAKTGAVAYGAGQLGKAMQGGDQATSATADNRPETGYGSKAWDDARNQLAQQRIDAVDAQNSMVRDLASRMGISGKELHTTMAGGVPTRINGIPVPTNLYTQDQLNALDAARAMQGITNKIRESQIRKAFYLAEGLQSHLNEGMWDSIKGAAGKAAGAVGKYVQTKGHNLTTRVTADKLMSAWKSAGSPTDSEAVADVMRNAGVDEEIVQRVLAAVAKTPAAPTTAKKHTGGKVAGQVSQTPNAVRQRQARAAKKTQPTTTTKPSAGAGAFGQMASQLSGNKTPTSTIHRATPNNPNAAYAESYVRQIAESWEEYKVDEAFGGISNLAKGAGKLGGGIVGGVKKIGTGIASPFRDVAAGYRAGKVDSKTNEIANKAYRAWSAYRQQLDKAAPGGKADPATIEKQLMAFVSKNLLGGQYLPNLINKNEILGLVKQIAGTNVAKQAPQKDAPGVTDQPPGTKQAPVKKGARMGKAPSAKTPAGTGTDTTTPAGKTAPGAGAFGQMTSQLGGTAGTTSTGGTATPTATGVKHTASATNPNQPPASPPPGGGNPPQKMKVAVRPDGTTQAVAEPVKAPTTQPGVRAGKVPSTPAGSPATPATEPISIGGQKLNPKNPKDAALIKKLTPAIKEAAAPAQEFELFKKLVTQAAQAQSEVATGETPGAPSTGNKNTQNAQQDPKALAGQVAQVEKQGGVDPAVLAKAGAILQKAFKKGSPSVKKTGDAAVDALLINMGFQL